MTKVTAQLNNLRIAPRKVRLIADRVRGQKATDAIATLQYDLRKPAEPVQKLLKSAVANAQNDFGLKEENLYVSEITVGEGPTLKRWQPRAYGRASKILKRTSRIRVVLSESVEEEKKAVEKKEEKKEKKNNSQKVKK